MNKYGKNHDLKDEIIAHIVENQLQTVEKDMCGMYQIYFCVNLFNPLENGSIINEKIMKKQTTEKLLNEILLTDRQENENRIKQFIEESTIRCG